MNNFLLLVGTLCLIALYKIGQMLYKLMLLKINTAAIPGPKTVPILGNAVTLMNLRIQDVVHYIFEQACQFKDGLYALWFSMYPVIVITLPRHLEKILPSTVNITKSLLYDPIRPWLGRGLLTSDGEQWFRDRKLITPTFHFSILEKFAPVINGHCQNMMKCIQKKWKKNPEEPVEMYDIILKCALDIVCSTAMGIDINCQEQDIEYIHALHSFEQLAVYRAFRPWFKYKWVFYLSSAGREYYAQLKIIHQFTRNVIRKRIEWRKTHKDKLGNDEYIVDDLRNKRKKALLDHLLDTSENASIPMTEEEVREQIDTFMIAGHITSAIAFVWALFCVGNSPEHQEKVHEELDAVFGDSERPATLKDLTELKYLDRVLKESLRMYPSVAIFGRHLTEDVDLGEHIIPKGAGVIISPFVTHRHPDVWPNPEKFDPDRFLPDNMKTRSPYAYIPFSAGPRNCIGQKFAQIEEKIMAIYVLRKWNIKSVLRHDQVEMTHPVVLQPLNGIHLYLTPRK